MQASVNPKAETVEELLSRRKNLHLGMLKLAQEDLAIHLQAGIDACKVPRATTRASTRRASNAATTCGTQLQHCWLRPAALLASALLYAADTAVSALAVVAFFTGVAAVAAS